MLYYVILLYIELYIIVIYYACAHQQSKVEGYAQRSEEALLMQITHHRQPATGSGRGVASLFSRVAQRRRRDSPSWQDKLL